MKSTTWENLPPQTTSYSTKIILSTGFTVSYVLSAIYLTRTSFNLFNKLGSRYCHSCTTNEQHPALSHLTKSLPKNTTLSGRTREHHGPASPSACECKSEEGEGKNLCERCSLADIIPECKSHHFKKREGVGGGRRKRSFSSGDLLTPSPNSHRTFPIRNQDLD